MTAAAYSIKKPRILQCKAFFGLARVLLLRDYIYKHSLDHVAVSIIAPIFTLTFTGEECDPICIFVFEDSFRSKGRYPAVDSNLVSVNITPGMNANPIAIF